MDNIKDDIYYAKRILKSEEVLTRYLGGKTLDDLLNDGFLRDAIENRFTKIAEDASHLSKEFKTNNSNIPWGAITKIRNTVCHDYDVVDASSLYKTIKINFVSFKNNLLAAITYHRRELDHKTFTFISTQQKTVAIRLPTKETKSLAVGSLVVFTNTKTKQQLIAEIIDFKEDIDDSDASIFQIKVY